jgi:Flp pilus assembly protein TadD/4-amino-4-deoxy-L-arabinose transferase-like glycosyltransferase
MRRILRMKKGGAKPRSDRFVILGLIALAIGVRLTYYKQLSTNPFFEYAIVDSDSYDKMARLVVEGKDPYPGQPFFQPPLYPYFLGLLYAVFGPGIPTARLLQMLLGIVNVVLLFLLGSRLFSRSIAIGSAVVLSLYGIMLFFEGELLAPVLIVFLNLLLTLSLISLLEKPGKGRAFVTGLVFGASAITMSVILPFALVVLIYGYAHFKRFQHPPSSQSLLIIGSAFLLGIALVIAPVTVRNQREGGDAALISSNAGINFYVGTGKDFDKKVGIRPGYQWQALGQEPMRLGYKKASEQSQYFMRKSWNVIREDPWSYVGALAYKLYLFAHGNEIMRNQEIYPFRQYSPLLAGLAWKRGIAFPYGILFPLACMGVFLAVRGRANHVWLLTSFIVTHILVIILFFISARYRMNVLPFLVMFAVYGVSTVINLVRSHQWRRAKPAITLAVGFFVLSNWNVGTMPATFNEDAYYNLGVKYLDEDRDKAKTMFQKAVELVPSYPEANGNLGILLHQEGDHAGARRCFELVLNPYPDDVETNINMGILLFSEGNIDSAKALFRRVLRLEPGNEIARSNLAILEAEKPERTTIPPPPHIVQLQLQLQTEPDNPALLTNLGAAYLSMKDYAAAVDPLEKAVRLDSSLAQAHNNLGIALFNVGRVEEARAAFKTALRLEPTNASAKRNLERLESELVRNQ